MLEWLFLIPVIAGSIYAIIRAWSVLHFGQLRGRISAPIHDKQPPVSILKPVCGLEKNLKRNLRSACLQDYADYQVIYAVQDPNDAALRVIKGVQAEFGADRVSVVVSNIQAGANGKVNNLVGALAAARHDILVISDSDTYLRSDYLAKIVAPLSDPHVGCAFTPFRVVEAQRWYERMELLSINADFMPDVIFAELTGAANACLGPSLALRRSALEAIGGLESLADYLVEDYELGRRLWTSGKKVVMVPYVIDVTVDLPHWRQWWTHQIYWDQNTRFARPGAFFATLLVRSVPFALLYASTRTLDPLGVGVLMGVVMLRMATAAISLRWGFRDNEGLRSLALLPLRDMATLLTWALAFTKRTVRWRGVTYHLMGDGRMVRLTHKHGLSSQLGDGRFLGE